MKSPRLFIFTIIFLIWIGCQKEGSNEPIRLQGTVFGTTYSITYYGDDNYEAEIDKLFTAVNKSLSTYIPNSDISKINKGVKDIEVDTLFKEVFQKSERVFRETNGYFDPTVGNLVNAWGFGPERPLNNLDAAKVDSILKFVGFDKVAIKNGKVVKQYDETYFDFNAIAKGFGIDVVGRFLERKSIRNYLVEIGGEIRTRGTKPGKKKWKVQLEKPNTDGSRSAFTFIELKDKSMASSGNYRKFRIDKNGQKYVHTINPKTGYAIESNLLSATVIAGLDCADTDAYATAFMAMGLEKTKAFLTDKPYLEVILLYADSGGKLTAYTNRK